MQSQQELRQVALCIALVCRNEYETVNSLLIHADAILSWLKGKAENAAKQEPVYKTASELADMYRRL